MPSRYLEFFRNCYVLLHQIVKGNFLSNRKYLLMLSIKLNNKALLL